MCVCVCVHVIMATSYTTALSVTPNTACADDVIMMSQDFIVGVVGMYLIQVAVASGLVSMETT